MSERRGRGEGSVYQRHDKKTCPATIEVIGKDGNRKKVRPDHKCVGTWAAVVDFGWSAGVRQRKTVYGKTKGEVLNKVDKLKRGNGHIATGEHTIESWMTYWLNEICEPKLKPQTMSSHRSKVNTYIIPLLGKHRLDTIEPRHVRDMYNRMRMACPRPGDDDKCPHTPHHGLAEATLRQTHAILKTGLKIAIRERQTQENVTMLVDPPGTEQAEPDRLTPAEARLVLAAAAGAGYESRWYCAFHQGMRQGEVLGLAWAMVNFDEGTITIARTLTTAGFGTPKSRASKRTIPMTPQTLAHLKVHWAQYVADCQAAGVDPDHSSLVWRQKDGSPVGSKMDWQRWKRLLASAGVPHVSLHSARSTTAAILEEAGVLDRLAAEILGHADVKQTYRYQRDAGLENKRKAMVALEAAWGATN